MLILVGPSASGKTQILKILMEKYGMKKLVTYTTRNMRVNEVDGVDYHFITKEDFMEKAESGFFFETIEYNNNYYGTAKNDFSNDKAVILEPNGLYKYIDDAKDQIKIVVLKCEENVLRNRMIFRQDKLEDIEKRINGDKTWFKADLYEQADLILDTSHSDIFDDAERVYSFYKESMK